MDINYQNIVRIGTEGEEIQYIINNLWLKLNAKPSIYRLINDINKKKFFTWLTQYKSVIESEYSEKYSVGKKLKGTTTVIICLEKNVYIQYTDSEENYIYNISLYYHPSISIKTIEEEYILPLSALKTHTNSGSQFYLIATEYGGYRLDPVSVKYKYNSSNLTLNYGDSFAEIDKNVILRLKNDSNGLFLFHGKCGTGKTSYIRSIIYRLGKKKKIIYIPPNMFDQLMLPDFISFLTEHRNSILIIEDAEQLLTSREAFNSSGISNLLNLTDGLLNDCLNFQVIATYNTNKEKIDSALLRPGRLFVHHEFGLLSPDNANRLYEHLYSKKGEYTKEISISEIYSSEPIQSNPIQTSIGFKKSKI